MRTETCPFELQGRLSSGPVRFRRSIDADNHRRGTSNVKWQHGQSKFYHSGVKEPPSAQIQGGWNLVYMNRTVPRFDHWDTFLH